MSASEQNKTSVRFQFLGIRSEATAAHPSRSFNPSASDLAASEPEARQPAAMTALARRLLVGRDAPFDPQRALALILSAKALGDAEAPLLEATLAAAGAWRPQSWTDALDLLAIAADRGAVDIPGQGSALGGEDEAGRGRAETRREDAGAIGREDQMRPLRVGIEPAQGHGREARLGGIGLAAAGVDEVRGVEQQRERGGVTGHPWAGGAVGPSGPDGDDVPRH